MTDILIEEILNDLEKEQYVFSVTAELSMGIQARLLKYTFYSKQTKRHKFKAIRVYSWIDRQMAKNFNRTLPEIPYVSQKIIDKLKKTIIEDLVIHAE